MNVGVIGLGRMGVIIAQRLIKAGHDVYGFDLSEASQKKAQEAGVSVVADVKELAEKTRIFWLMIPAGDPVDRVLETLSEFLQPGDIVVDGGNSYFQNTLKRYAKLAEKNVSYMDCGTSGGVKGKEIGFSLMIGGDKQTFEKIEPLFEAIAAPDGYAYMGPSGAGHYVKMIHNGIEYSMLQAYAEGFHLLKKGHYKDLDLARISKVWNHGSVIRSWIGELLHGIFSHDQELEDISGEIGENMTGRWTMDEAERQNIAMDLLKRSLEVRKESRKTGGNYATKVVAMLRNAFGGHEVKKK